MAADLSLDQWKTFLRARLAQESGKDAEALEVFERLVAANPGNAHLQSSRAFALERLNRGQDAAGARIGAAYARAAASLTGSADKPENWTAELNALINEVDVATQGRGVSASLVAW
jgi:hypothetical protein